MDIVKRLKQEPPSYTMDFDAADEIIRLRAELAECRRLLRRYYTETPLGHQPHMIAHEAEAALAEGEKR